MDSKSSVLTEDPSQQNIVRESLSVIKRKVTEKSVGVNNLRRFSNPAINQSTSRDSESLTPLTADDFDRVQLQGVNNHSQFGEYDEKYFEEKQRESLSLKMDSIPRKVPMLQREVSNESVEDYAVTGADDDKNEDKLSFIECDPNPELIFMHSSSNADKIRRRFHPRSSENYEISPPRLIKSSSAVEGISASGKLNKIIPKLANFDVSTRKQSSHPYSQSVSARIIRPDRVQHDSVSRPHTSKAALGQVSGLDDSQYR
jgi:hypothetical protein